MRKKQILEYTPKKLQTNILPETFIFFNLQKNLLGIWENIFKIINSKMYLGETNKCLKLKRKSSRLHHHDPVVPGSQKTEQEVT